MPVAGEEQTTQYEVLIRLSRPSSDDLTEIETNLNIFAYLNFGL
jgi:hypothetical protein